ncbi:hypothetical protein JCM21531_3679 [Acetivibrio straminisolvens JCM 21531]|uniref:Uncharacterized protein n=1 Tax=Acetivibrio straminisolvens JCM 21531 TaxID=1294263 RepID=W4VBG7_9FIRM|nr:hypothetical protein JCM21531_3679 [Acetivibrio straminisolvens JCM 21531]
MPDIFDSHCTEIHRKSIKYCFGRAMKVDATRPTKESGPCTLNMSDNIAKDALPDMGRRKTMGKASVGIFKKSATGFTA